MHVFKPQLLGKSPVRKVILEKVLTHVILSNSEARRGSTQSASKNATTTIPERIDYRYLTI